MESGVIELDEEDGEILGDNRVSERRGVRLAVDRLDKTKKIKRPFVIILLLHAYWW